MKPGDLVAGRYSLIRPIGVGGMGCVWAARHEGIDREVALKIPDGPHAGNPELRSRFLAEAKALGRLRHPNIVDVLDSGQLDDGRLFIAFELLDGTALDAYLYEVGRMRGSDAVKIAIELCRGLEFAHGAGVIHRDLKPANVFLHNSPGGGMLVKLLDFGISKTFIDDGVSVSLTNTGNVVGTPLYMSAEQAQGDEIDPRTDLWNVGVVLYEMLAGLSPFEGKSYSATVAKIVSQTAPPLSSWGVYTPPELEEIIFRCLEKDRARRYGSALALRQALEEVLPLVKHATPTRLSITSLVDSLPSLPPPPSSAAPVVTSERRFPPDAQTLPPPASSLRPVTHSFDPITPPPSNITIHPRIDPPRSSWKTRIAAAAALILLGALAAILVPRLVLDSSTPASPAPRVDREQDVMPESPASGEAAAVPPVSPAVLDDAGSEASAASAPPPAEGNTDRAATDRPKESEPARRDEPAKQQRNSGKSSTTTKVDDPGF